MCQVCDGRGDPCDSRCGGAGCGKCGGLSCSDGAVTKASNALDLARQADDIIREKGEAAMELLAKVTIYDQRPSWWENDRLYIEKVKERCVIVIWLIYSFIFVFLLIFFNLFIWLIILHIIMT